MWREIAESIGRVIVDALWAAVAFGYWIIALAKG
jgi:hypothetical protein